MPEFLSWINQPLPIGIVMLIAIAVLWIRVNENTRIVRSIEDTCQKRFTWCLNHHEPKKSSD